MPRSARCQRAIVDRVSAGQHVVAIGGPIRKKLLLFNRESLKNLASEEKPKAEKQDGDNHPTP